jgi:hypothetical protein
MKAYLLIAALCAVEAGAQITEPDTVFYGRIINPNSPAPFLYQAFEGTLSWTINIAATGQSQTFATKLQPLGDGKYSYRLAIPHYALGFNLPAQPIGVPLTASALRWDHVRIILNGSLAQIAAPAVTFTSAQQSSRASSYRVDLQLLDPVPDSDGDGIPDWWEDKNGLDKWDATDAAPVFARLNTDNSRGVIDERHITTLAEWRALYFPRSPGALTQFAEEDPDNDLIPNLVEYAFGLDPRNPSDPLEKLPSCRMDQGRLVLSFQRRSAATDLIYIIEASGDLLSWHLADETLEQMPAQLSTQSTSTALYRCKASDQDYQFLRVKVGLK